MKKGITTIILIVLVSISYAQRHKGFKRAAGPNQEFGISLGVSNYLGDLAFKGKIPVIDESNPLAFRPAGGLYYRSNFTNFTSFKASLLLGGLYGNDAQTNGDKSRINRNLHFRSIVADVSLMLEWNLLPYKIGDKRKMFTPYFGIGVAGFYFNPQAELNGRWIDLQPLGTEGQGLIDGTQKYSLFQFAIPASFGFKVNISKRIALGLEFQYRYTFTDYIDDVSSFNYVNSDLFYKNYVAAVAADADALSYRVINKSNSKETEQRGDPVFKDNYYFVFVNLSFKIGKSNNTCPTFR